MSIDEPTTAAVVPPGRLGDPAMTIGTDPRADPRMLAVFEPLGMLGHADGVPLDRHAGRDQLLGFADLAEQALGGLFATLAGSWEPMSRTVVRETRTVPGPGGEITLHVHRPEGRDGPLPLIYQIHGGSMVVLSAAESLYVRWRDELAAAGAVVVGVEFRNAGGRLGPHPFPAGLDDCAAGVRWVHEHLAELGGTHVVLTGDSGGAGLCLALAIRAGREGWADRISGVYAQGPFVLGTWDRPHAGLPSLRECDKYWLDAGISALLAEVYDPGSAHEDDPTCWPARATVDDLRGLPPHVIDCAELDPVRDEGIAYHRRLLAAGVPSVGAVTLGICHVGQIMFRDAMPDLYAGAVAAVVGFARRCAPATPSPR